MIFELCVETMEASLLAREGGAGRLELCSALALDGLSPSPAMVREVVSRSGLPVHAMVRPRAGEFVYSRDEVLAMEEEIARGLELGVAGFVLGVLREDSTVDVATTRRLAMKAASREVTFHRAFDRVPDQREALEQVIASGCHRVLTSGGAADVFAGRFALAELVAQAGERIAVAAGGGLRVETAAEVARVSGASQFHGTARRDGEREVRPGEIEGMVAALARGAAEAHRSS